MDPVLLEPKSALSGVLMQALSAAEQGEKDPLGRTSSTISLQLIMQSEAAGLFNTPGSGKDGHAILAASIARAQTDHEASQEAAIQESMTHDQPMDELQDSPQEQLGQTGAHLQTANSKKPPSKSQSWDHGRPGPLGFGSHDAPLPMTGMHSGELISMAGATSGELTLATSPILASKIFPEGHDN